MIRLKFIIIVICFSFFGFSQEEKDSLQVAEDFSIPVQNHSFDEKLSKKYNGEEFDYGTTTGEAQNLLSRFLLWLEHFLSTNFGFNISPEILKIIEILIYVIMGVLAIYLLVRFLVGENLSTLFLKKANKIIDINLAEDHINNVDIDAQIHQALAQKNYRLAVRYHYLKVLKNLSLNDIIKWEYEKTNSDYENEITSIELKTLFQEVSYLYDYIWYGEQDIDENTFKAAENRFLAMKSNTPN